MMFKALAIAAAMVIGGMVQGHAATAFSNDFSGGLGPNESVFGIFAAGNGSVGTQGAYGNNQVGSYAFTANLSGYTSATLNYNYSVNTEPCCDFLRVYVAQSPAALFDSTQLASYGGTVNGTASFDISRFIGSATTVLFRFTSDGSVTGAGVAVGPVSVSGSGGVGAPGPVVGAGLPFLVAAGAAWLVRRRRALKAA